MPTGIPTAVDARIAGGEPLTPTPKLSNGVWSRLAAQLEVVEARHAQYDDAETPRLSNAVLHGARRLLRHLEATSAEPPTLLTGTCDATVTLEWHEREGSQTFRSLDVLNETEAEEFIMSDPDLKTLRIVKF